MTGDRLPAFMVIGAEKAATTWVSQQLRAHPSLWLPKAEPHYFSSEYHRGIDWYRSLFVPAPADRLVGEKSADYLSHPDAAARIAALLPEVPLIVQLRDPVARAYSHYCMYYRRGMVGGDLRRYLDAGRSDESRFLVGGRYARHLERLLAHLPQARLKIILYDDIQEDPEAVITQLCAHIGVPVHLAPAEIERRSNDSAAPMLPLQVRRFLRPARRWLDPLRSNGLLSRVRASMARPVRYPPLTDEIRAMLRDYYRDDVRELGALLDRDMTVWSG